MSLGMLRGQDLTTGLALNSITGDQLSTTIGIRPLESLEIGIYGIWNGGREDLVTDPEPQLRQVMDFIELPWDDACLSFHQSKRINVTPSMDQVREPLYRGSMGRAGHYDAYLEPLKKALGAD